MFQHCLAKFLLGIERHEPSIQMIAIRSMHSHRHVLGSNSLSNVRMLGRSNIVIDSCRLVW